MAESKPINQNLEKLTQSLRAISDQLLDHVESSRTDHADVGVQVDYDNLRNQETKKANILFKMAVTALTENDLRKAEKFLIQSSNICSQETVTIMLKEMRSKIAQITENKPSECQTTPDSPVEIVLIVERLIFLAKKALSARDLKKAAMLIKSADEISSTCKTQQLPDEETEVSRLSSQRRKEEITKTVDNYSEVFIEHALNAIDDDLYDIAELLLQTAWIQYKNESAKKMLDIFMSCENFNQKIYPTNSIVTRTTEEQKEIADKYMKIAENMVTEGHVKVAESMMIIAGNTHYVNNMQKNPLTIKIHGSLYSGKDQYDVDCEWRVQGIHGFKDSAYCVDGYKCNYFLRMAFRAWRYGENKTLAQEFLAVAGRIFPTNQWVKKYKRILEKEAN